MKEKGIEWIYIKGAKELADTAGVSLGEPDQAKRGY